MAIAPARKPRGYAAYKTWNKKASAIQDADDAAL
jgi:hypothetical protein